MWVRLWYIEWVCVRVALCDIESGWICVRKSVWWWVNKSDVRVWVFFLGGSYFGTSRLKNHCDASAILSDCVVDLKEREEENKLMLLGNKKWIITLGRGVSWMIVWYLQKKGQEKRERVREKMITARKLFKLKSSHCSFSFNTFLSINSTRSLTQTINLILSHTHKPTHTPCRRRIDRSRFTRGRERSSLPCCLTSSDMPGHTRKYDRHLIIDYVIIL